MNDIPKQLGHIWVGPRKPPSEWMKTWRDNHPGWQYTLYDNHFLESREFKTSQQIEEYMRRGQYHGVADLLRYEILYETGGFLAAADSICERPIDELLHDGHTIYTVFENEFMRGNLVSPILASTPKHSFLGLLIDKLSKIPPDDLDEPWKQTGNLFVAEMIEEHEPNIKIWPSHYFIPEHYTGRKYCGDDVIFAHQMFGETTKRYEYYSKLDRFRHELKKRYAKKMIKRRRQRDTL